MLTKIVVDRSETEAVMAIGVAWIAFLMALPVFEPDTRSFFGMVVGALGAAGLIIVGFAAASRVRPMSKRARSEGLRLVGWSLSLGALMALINLAFNLGMASLVEVGQRLLHYRLTAKIGEQPRIKKARGERES